VTVGPPLSAFGFRRPLTVANIATVALPSDHSVCFSVPAADVEAARAAGRMRADFGDVRVFGPGGERVRVLDQRGPGVLAICFRLERAVAAGAKDDGYFLAYGAADVSPPAAADAAVFPFFDGFDGSSLSSAWLSAGAPVVHDGALTLRKGTDEPTVNTDAKTDGIPLDASLEIRARVLDPNSAGFQLDGSPALYYSLGFQHYGDPLSTGEPYTIFYGGKGTIETRHEMLAPSACSNMICAGASVPQTSTFRVYRIDRRGDGVRFTYDDGKQDDQPGSSGDTAVMFRSFLRDSDVAIDWVRARPLIWPEPTFTLSPELRGL
jgi:hypothetical protein